MVKTTTSAKLFIKILILIFFVAGCDESNNEKSWNIFNKAIKNDTHKVTAISDSEIYEIYNNYLNSLNNVVLLCEKFPEIRRVSQKDGGDSFYNVTSSETSQLNNATHEIKDIIRNASVLAVKCERRGDFEGNPLSVVSFIVYASGISVSGSLKSISYLTDWKKNHALADEKNLSKLGFEKLPKEGWYIYNSK